MTRWKGAFVSCLAVLSGLLLAAAADAEETEDRLLKASEGLQMPGSEADSVWWFVSYPTRTNCPPPSASPSLPAAAIQRAASPAKTSMPPSIT